MPADDFDPRTAPAYQQGVTASGATYLDGTPVRVVTHEEVVRNRLGWIVAGVWVIAGGVILNFIVGFVVGFSATYH